MQAILSKLSPASDVPWGAFLYTILVLVFITLMLQKNAGLGITLMLSAVILFCVIDQVAAGSNAYWGTGNSKNYFAPFMMHVGMFAIPLMVAGMTKSEKSRGPAILAFVIAVVYWLIRWTQIPK